MSYVPGLSHDIFLSYAHEDAAWVNALHEELTERLGHRLGSACDVWQDENRLRAGQKWSDEIAQAIRDSAAFIAVLSRSYQGSEWCEKELAEFLGDDRRHGGFEAGGYSRFLKVVKFPFFRNAHLGFYPKFQHAVFFTNDPKTGQEREFRENSASFRNGVDKLSFDIERLFEAMLRGRAKVFVGRSADANREEREAIARQLKEEGYALTPPPEGAIPRGLDRKTLKELINDAPVTVHVLGAAYDPDVRTQIDLAIESEKRLIFCLAKDWAKAVGEQAQLIETVRENRWNLEEGRWALLQSRSMVALVQDLLGLLLPGRPVAKTPEEGLARVYLVCDPTTSEDVSFARDIQERIRTHERIEVELPQASSETRSLGAQHDRLLGGCDGLLVYREKAPANWYNRNLADLLTAESRSRSRALKSKALLVGDAVVLPGLTVIQRQDPFDLAQLESFLAPLRTPGVPGDANHAGH